MPPAQLPSASTISGHADHADPGQRPPAHFEVLACCGMLFCAALAAFLAPPLGQLLSLAACVLCARFCRALLPIGLAFFAHAGSVVFASRALEAESSDFAVYFELFKNICSSAVPLQETLWSFGLEWGLPVTYHGLAAAGACGLSINGLAYLQSMALSTVFLACLGRWSLRGQLPSRAALVLGGTLAMFSFVYTTQLSRQAISSLFVLLALFETRHPRLALLWLVPATAFHLTAPLVYVLAQLLRARPRLSVLIAIAMCGVTTLLGPELIQWGLDRADSIPGLDKLAYYSQEFDADEAVGSDLRAAFYLGLAAAVSWRWRKSADAAMAADARMLFGFALMALVLLALPLAATRLTLAFSSLAIGYYLFKGLANRSPRLALFALITVAVLRSGLSTAFGSGDQGMWDAYGPFSFWPLYYLGAF